MPNRIPEFGTANDVAELTLTKNTEPVELTDGLSKKQYTLSVSDTLTMTRPIYTEFGIAASGAGAQKNSLGAVITSATLTLEEEVSDVHKTCTEEFRVAGGHQPSDGDKLTYATAMKWLRVKTTISLEGKGKLPDELKRGTVAFTQSNLKLCSATPQEQEPIINEGNLYVENTTQTGLNTQFHTWSASLVKWTETASTDESPLKNRLVLIDTDEGGDLTSNYYKITITKRMTEERPLELTETVEIYDDESDTTPIP